MLLTTSGLVMLDISSQLMPGPGFVLAKKYKCFPSRSKIGLFAFDKPSVMRVFVPVATLYTKTACMWLSMSRAQVSHLESGDQRALMLTYGSVYVEESTSVFLPVATS